jgi:hypothetical protein
MGLCIQGTSFQHYNMQLRLSTISHLCKYNENIVLWDISTKCKQHKPTNGVKTDWPFPGSQAAVWQTEIRQIYMNSQLLIIRNDIYNVNGRSLDNPPTYGGWITSPPTYETGCFTPRTIQNRTNHPLRQFWTAVCYSKVGFVFFSFLLFRLNHWKSIVNHRKIIKWKIQFCCTPRE